MLNHTLQERVKLLRDTLENQLAQVQTQLKDKIIVRVIIKDINPDIQNQKKSKIV